MRLRLLDRDNDLVEANDASEWDNFEDCLADVKASFLQGDMSNSYLPFSFIDVESHRTRKKCDVYNIIKEVDITFKTTNLKVIPYKYKTA
jgi:hypothetical protein